MKYKKLMMLTIILVTLLAVSTVSAANNVTGDVVGVDNSTEVLNLNDEGVNQEYDSENFQPRIIPEGYGYRQNIPQQINYSTDYDDYYGYYISIVDEYGYNIPYLEARLVDANANEVEMVFYYDEDEDAYWCCVSAMGVGNHSCKIIVDDYYYNIKPIDFNLEIVKSDVKLIIKENYLVKGDYAIIKAKVTDMEGISIWEDGKVKFTINGKNYYRNIDKNGYATLKIKMNKEGTFTYSAIYTGDKNHNPSTTKKSKVHVLSTSKSARTFKIKGYSIVLSLDKYKKLVNAKNTNKAVCFEIKTNKYVKQKVGNYKNKLKRVKAKVSIIISYGGKTGDQYAPANKYYMCLTTPYQNPGYEYCTPWLYGAKKSTELNKLNNAKTTKW